MNPRGAILMIAGVLVAGAVLKAFPALRAFVAANSLAVRDNAGNSLYDAI